MKKYVLLALLLTCSATAYSQQYYRIDVGKLDTLFFYAQKGKICDTTLQTHLNAITALQISEGEKARLIELQASQLKTYAELDRNWGERLQNQGEAFQIDKQKLKNKVRKQRRIIFAETAGIVALIALVLLL